MSNILQTNLYFIFMMKNCHSAKCVGGWISWVLIAIGGINWGLVAIGIFAANPRWNVVHLIIGGVGRGTPWLEALIYLLVGLATIGAIIGCRCKKCKAGCGCTGGSCGGNSTMSSSSTTSGMTGGTM